MLGNMTDGCRTPEWRLRGRCPRCGKRFDWKQRRALVSKQLDISQRKTVVCKKCGLVIDRLGITW